MLESIDNLKIALNREKYEGVILRIERLAGLSKLPVIALYEKLYEKTGDKVYLEIIDKLNEGLPKSKVYEKYVSKEVLLILKESEKRNLPIHKVIEKIIDLKKLQKQIKGKVYSKLYFAVGYFIFISFVTYFLLKGLENNFGKIDLVKNKEFIEAVINLYPFVISGILVLIYLVFFQFKYKTPIVSKIFITTESSLILMITRLLYSVDIPMVSILQYFTTFNNYFKDKFMAILNMETGDYVGAFVEALKDALEPEEGAVLETAFTSGRFDEFLEILANEKKETIEEKLEGFGKMLMYFGIGLSIIPIGMLLASYMNVVMQIVNNALELMNR